MTSSSKRILQLNEQVREILALMIARQEVRDPRVLKATIQSVKLTEDLRLAKIYFSLLDKNDKASVLLGLNSAKKFMRKMIADKLGIRHTPELNFYYDDSLDHFFKMQNLIHKVAEHDKKLSEENVETSHKSDE